VAGLILFCENESAVRVLRERAEDAGLRYVVASAQRECLTVAVAPFDDDGRGGVTQKDVIAVCPIGAKRTGVAVKSIIGALEYKWQSTAWNNKVRMLVVVIAVSGAEGLIRW